MKSRTKEGAFYCLNDIEDFALGPKNTLFAACGNQSGHLFNTEVLNNELIHDDEDKCRNAVVEGRHGYFKGIPFHSDCVWSKRYQNVQHCVKKGSLLSGLALNPSEEKPRTLQLAHMKKIATSGR